ncbi:Nif3-like dinuclear metal center hexameric protein [Pediococcus argentinicus]|uniref:Nif3-like dinuclear metal center hexameric protein n=1 Tax=Pediococcus argentinicus TaxID=480391 RepID=UPI0033901C1F
MKAADLISTFEDFAPQSLAVSGDPIGVQIGDVNREIKRVLVTLDVRPEVVQEAVEQKCDMIFSHHPVMFRSARNLDFRNSQNKMYGDIISNNIFVYSAHTNLDSANPGMNDWLAHALKLTDVKPLLSIEGPKHGMGRIGDLVQAQPLKDFVSDAKSAFGVSGVRLTSNDVNQQVKRVAVLGGDGGKFYPEAIEQGADVYVTGDVYYHTAHEMLTDGLNVVDPGHNIEKICIPYLVQMFTEWSKENNWDLEAIPSEINTDPFTFM